MQLATVTVLIILVSLVNDHATSAFTVRRTAVHSAVLP